MNYSYDDRELLSLVNIQLQTDEQGDDYAVVHLVSEWDGRESNGKEQRLWYQEFTVSRADGDWLISDFDEVYIYRSLTPTPSPAQNISIGETASLWEGNITVLGWEYEEGDKGCLGLNLKDGNTMIWVDVLTVHPEPDEDYYDARRFFDMAVKDETAQVFDRGCIRDLVAHKEGRIHRAEYGFEVPQIANEYELVVDTSAGKVFVPLGSAPTHAEIPQELIFVPDNVSSIGEKINISPFSITINEIRPAGDGEGSFGGSRGGYVDVVIDLTLENQDDLSYTIDSETQMWVQDSVGQKYWRTFHVNSPDKELVSGESVRGQVGFTIPESLDLWFVFMPTGSEQVFLEIP